MAKLQIAAAVGAAVGKHAWTMIDPPKEVASKFRNMTVTIHYKSSN